MKQSKSRPKNATSISTYADLQDYALAFANGHLGLLVLCGAAGIGKSRCLRDAVGDDVCWIDGNASAFGIYCKAYEHRDQPIVLDDVDGLYKDRQGVRLLKTLCQTDPVKRLSWQTAAGALEKRDIPREFTTSSHLAVIVNRWESLNADVVALEDRGHLIVFAPAAMEVHRHAAAWFWDQEIFDFVGKHLGLINQPSLRIYHRASELKMAGLPWQEVILSCCLTGKTLAVAELKADPKFKTEEERVQAFIAAGHGCRATYFNHAQKLSAAGSAPSVTLSTNVNPFEARPKFDLIEILKKRHRKIGNG